MKKAHSRSLALWAEGQAPLVQALLPPAPAPASETVRSSECYLQARYITGSTARRDDGEKSHASQWIRCNKRGNESTKVAGANNVITLLRAGTTGGSLSNLRKMTRMRTRSVKR